MPLTHYIRTPARIRARSGIVYHTEQERQGMLAAKTSDAVGRGHWLCTCGVWTPDQLGVCRGCGEPRNVNERKAA